MKLKNTAIALSITSLGLFANSGKAQAAIFTVGGSQYDVETIPTSFNDSSALLQSQPFFGSASLAQTFAATVNVSLGLPNFGNDGPFFAYNSTVSGFEFVAFLHVNGVFPISLSPFVSATYATASLVAVPEPSEVLGTLFFGAISAGYLLKRQSR